MSTFDGFVLEFPLIRIDRFKNLPGRSPPLACFLSHIHSDHLLGLESLKSPFVYCSAATRELLLRLEKYPHRMNLARGILECRIQTFKHLRRLLKPLPLGTPITIGLSPGNEIQVTLFDANHCLGSVMFLIEGDGKAILYTGDIRSEVWWVNALTRHPIIIPYSTGRRRLDKIYLDTTFAVKSKPHRDFPSKSEGIAELLEKVSDYPADTIFFFNTWTFGYEDVWVALANALRSPVHLDRYRHGLYVSIASADEQGSHPCRETPSLAGFRLGNGHQPGILTRSPQSRIHSCEKGSGCPLFDNEEDETSDIITITPIISRHAGIELRELGAGGGKSDLSQTHELDLSDPAAAQHLLRLCSSSSEQQPHVSSKLSEMLQALAVAGMTRLSLDDVAPLLDRIRSEGSGTTTDEIPLRHLPNVIAELVAAREAKSKSRRAESDLRDEGEKVSGGLSKVITFPYSRHSSYGELRALVAAFRPRDVWPCTAPPPDEWHEDISMETLFGDLCEPREVGFAHDTDMRALAAQRHEARLRGGRATDCRTGDGPTLGRESQRIAYGSETESEDGMEKQDATAARQTSAGKTIPKRLAKRDHSVMESSNEVRSALPVFGVAEPGLSCLESNRHKARLRARKEAYVAAQTGNWHTIQLLSTMSSQGDEELL